jgi:hypothetical protein
MAFDVVVPDIIGFFPGYRQDWRILFHDRLALVCQGVAPPRVDLTVDLIRQCIELLVLPK